MRQRVIGLLMGMLLSGSAIAGIGSLSSVEQVGGLKDALSQGAIAAVSRLGVVNGFLGNPKVKIGLPSPLDKADKLMRLAGMGRQSDELVTTMNRAAEMAVPEAKALFLGAIRQMSFADARGILMGGDDAATQYFKRTTTPALTAKFLPIVKQKTDTLSLAQQYNSYAGQAGKLGLLSKQSSSVEGYVTQKALDGLFLVMGEEERALRQNPVKAGTSLLKKVFGALR
jgi:hypothetical protein